MRYFGTDGIRGVYGSGITEDLAYRAGRALATAIGGKALIGRDTRASGPSIADALASGIAAGGADVCSAGVLTTPAVSYLTASRGYSFGVAVSASHNPPEYNGLKVFVSDGRKLPASLESAVEYYMDNSASFHISRGERTEWGGGEDAYVASVLGALHALASSAGRTSDLQGMRILLDGAGGAGTNAALRVFAALGAQTDTLCKECRGECINVRCGALHPEAMCAAAGNYDLGAALDGDADRLVLYDGRLLAGDEVLYNLARYPVGDTVVGTVLTNSALERRLQESGRRLLRTDVGDKNISEVMRALSARLGGEPSGHFIIGGVTGDGILSAAAAAVLKVTGGLYTLSMDVQASADIPIPPSGLPAQSRIADAERQAARLATRVVIRPSGTEPVLRVMAEGGDAEGAVNAVKEMLA